MIALDFAKPAADKPRLNRHLRSGLFAILLFFGGFGLWAALAPLSSAALASGQVRAESHRKTIQHLEGGIIREILVKEGQIVRKGQVLVRIDDTQAGATTSMYEGQRDSLKVLEARLIAERDGLSSIRHDPSIASRQSEPMIAQMIAGQERIFRSRREMLLGKSAVFRQQVEQLKSESEAYRAQANSADEQMRLAQDEIKDVRQLLAQGLSTKPRLLALERQLASLGGNKGQQLSLIARTGQAMGQAHLEIANLQSEQAREVAAELREVQTKLAEFEDRFRAATDVRRRTVVVAPQAGRIVNMRHFTTGGVLQPGEPIMDIVPVGDALIIEAKVSPYDIDNVHAGQEAQVRLSAFTQRRLPIVIGKVVSISADALTDERSGESYYTAQVVLPTEQLSHLDGISLYSGMPAEVFIVTGEKTPLRYFLDPVFDSFGRSMREA